MPTSPKDELITHFKDEQSKYVYYVLALSVTAIGFAVSVSMDMKLHLKMIPLGLSILLWGISVYSGLRLLSWRNATTYANISYLEIMEGTHEINRTSPQEIHIALDVLAKIMKGNQSIVLKHGRYQNLGFFAGIAAFIVWRIIMMS